MKAQGYWQGFQQAMRLLSKYHELVVVVHP